MKITLSPALYPAFITRTRIFCKNRYTLYLWNFADRAVAENLMVLDRWEREMTQQHYKSPKLASELRDLVVPLRNSFEDGPKPNKLAVTLYKGSLDALEPSPEKAPVEYWDYFYTFLRGCGWWRNWSLV